MSFVCKRGYKRMCFQCREKNCEHFESEPPQWCKDFFENEEIKEKLKRISESRLEEEQEEAKRGRGQWNMMGIALFIVGFVVGAVTIIVLAVLAAGD